MDEEKNPDILTVLKYEYMFMTWEQETSQTKQKTYQKKSKTETLSLHPN